MNSSIASRSPSAGERSWPPEDFGLTSACSFDPSCLEETNPVEELSKDLIRLKSLKRHIDTIRSIKDRHLEDIKAFVSAICENENIRPELDVKAIKMLALYNARKVIEFEDLKAHIIKDDPTVKYIENHGSTENFAALIAAYPELRDLYRSRPNRVAQDFRHPESIVALYYYEDMREKLEPKNFLNRNQFNLQQTAALLTAYPELRQMIDGEKLLNVVRVLAENRGYFRTGLKEIFALPEIRKAIDNNTITQILEYADLVPEITSLKNHPDTHNRDLDEEGIATRGRRLSSRFNSVALSEALAHYTSGT